MTTGQACLRLNNDPLEYCFQYAESERELNGDASLRNTNAIDENSRLKIYLIFMSYRRIGVAISRRRLPAVH